MKLENMIVADEDGNENEMTKKDYIKAIVKELSVKPYESEQLGTVEPAKVVGSIINAKTNGKDQPEALQETYPDVIERVEADVEFTMKRIDEKKQEAADEKEKKKKEREEEKARKEKEKKEMAERQEKVLTAVSEGADEAAKDFLSGLDNIKGNLPKTISIAKDGDGFGIKISEKVTDDELGKTLGYMVGTSQNSEYLQRQVQFFIGDLAAAAVQRGVYKTALDASKAISTHLDKSGKRISPGAIDFYRRMADRTPVSLRNPKADPSAYLELSRIKRPRKGEKESKEDFESRVEKFEEDIKEIQESLSKGDIVTRKDVLPKVQELKYEHGIEKRPDPNEVNLSTSDMLRIVFLGEIVLKKMIGKHKDDDGEVVEDSVALMDTENNNVIFVHKDKISELVEECRSELQNILLKGKKHEIKDMLAGFKTVEKEVPVATDADGKAVTEKRKVKEPVYLPAFFPITNDMKDEEAEEEEEG